MYNHAVHKRLIFLQNSHILPRQSA